MSPSSPEPSSPEPAAAKPASREPEPVEPLASAAQTWSTPPSSTNAPFRRFLFARAASSFGYQMLSVAVAWQIYAITGRALDLGLIGLAQFVPSLLLLLPAGHVADQYDRRRIVVRVQVFVIAALLVLAGFTLADRIHELGLLALVFAIGLAMAFQSPAVQSMLPALVDDATLPKAMARASSVGQLSTIVGPAVGGVLYAFGPSVVYLAAAALYALSVAILATLAYRQAPVAREAPSLATVFAGVHFIRRNRDVLGVISLDLFAVLLGGATALLPIFAKDVLHTGPVGLGILRGAPAVGALAMSLWLAHRAIERRVGMRMFAAVAGFGVATLVFAFSHTLWLSVAALAALGAFDMVSVVIRNSLVQLETPDAMRGRVNSVNAIFINTSNQLGEFESGMLAAWIGAVPAVVVGGIGTLAVVGLWMWWFPSLRRRERLRGDPATATGS